MTAEEIRRKRTRILATSTIALLFLGLIYAFSMFAGPLCAAFGLPASGIGLTFNLMMIAFCLGGLAGSALQKRVGLRWELTLAGILFCIGFVGTGLFGAGGLAVVYALYGICGGLGVGIGYNALVATTNVWFPDKVGFSSGILMLGFGVSALILGNLSLQLAGAWGLPTVLVVLGIVTLAITVAASFVVEAAPANIAETLGCQKKERAGAEDAHSEKPWATAIFWIYWVWVIIVNAAGLATIGNAASDAQLAGFDAATAILLASLISVANGLSRIITGSFYDRRGVVATMCLASILATSSVLLIICGVSTTTGVLYAAGALLCGLCYGSCPVVSSAFARQRYGSRDYPFNLSVVNFSLVVASLVNILVSAVAGASGRLPVFITMAVLSVVALADLVPFSRLWKHDTEGR